MSSRSKQIKKAEKKAVKRLPHKRERQKVKKLLDPVSWNLSSSPMDQSIFLI